MADPNRVPRSITQEIQALDVAIEAAEKGTQESPNDFDVAVNQRELEKLRALRNRWAWQAKMAMDERMQFELHLLALHTRLAQEHLDTFVELLERKRQ
jgi:hypothetical protein